MSWVIDFINALSCSKFWWAPFSGKQVADTLDHGFPIVGLARGPNPDHKSTANVPLATKRTKSCQTACPRTVGVNRYTHTDKRRKWLHLGIQSRTFLLWATVTYHASSGFNKWGLLSIIGVLSRWLYYLAARRPWVRSPGALGLIGDTKFPYRGVWGVCGMQWTGTSTRVSFHCKAGIGFTTAHDIFQDRYHRNSVT